MAAQILTTIDQLKEHVAVDFVNHFDVIEYAVEEREQELQRKYLGEGTYEALVAFIVNNNSQSDKKAWAQLLFHCRRYLANFSFLDYIPEGQLEISENGIRIVTNEDRKQAFDWQIKKLEAKYEKSGNKALENLLAFLEKNVDTFTSWATSEAFTLNKRYFINSAEVFQELVDIGYSRRVFLQLIPSMQKVEEFHLQEALGEAFFEELKEKVLDLEEQEADYKPVFRMVRGAVANLTAVMEHKRLDVDPQEYDRYGHAYIQKLKEHLNTKASASLFANYFNSDAYTAPADYSQNFIDNSQFNGNLHCT